MTYTRIEFWRGTDLQQIVEICLDGKTRLQASRLLRVWLLRMASLEVSPDYTVRIRVGSVCA